MEQTEEWFDQIYIKYFDLLFKIAFASLKNRELAEDIAQNTFVTLLMKQERLRDHANMKGWLITTTRNLIKNELQRASYRLEVPLSPEHELKTADSPDDFLTVLPPELSENERKILYLFYEIGLPHEQIAAELGCTETACRMRLYRARKHCQDCWGKNKNF